MITEKLREERMRKNKGLGGRRGLDRGIGRGCRSGSKREPYDGNSIEDYARCVCGDYTHQKQIKVIILNT